MNQISKVSFKHSVTLYLLVSEQYVFDKEMLKGRVTGIVCKRFRKEKKSGRAELNSTADRIKLQSLLT